MKSGFGNLFVWISLMLLASSVAWGQGLRPPEGGTPNQAPNQTPTLGQAVQAFDVLTGISPYYTGPGPEIDAERQNNYRAFQILRGYLLGQVAKEKEQEASNAKSKKAEDKPSVEDSKTDKGVVEASTETKAEADPVANAPVKAGAEAVTDTAPAAPSPVQDEAAAKQTRKRRGK